jgi:hypothetical protein
MVTPSVGDYRVEEYRAYTVGDDGHFFGFEPRYCQSSEYRHRGQRTWQTAIVPDARSAPPDEPVVTSGAGSVSSR